MSLEKMRDYLYEFCRAQPNCFNCPLFDLDIDSFCFEDDNTVEEQYNIVKSAMMKKEGDNMPNTDNINPNHYKRNGMQCIDAIDAATEHLSGRDAVDTGNAIKYLWRWKEKNGIEDLNKAIWYIKDMIKHNGGEVHE